MHLEYLYLSLLTNQNAEKEHILLTALAHSASFGFSDIILIMLQGSYFRPIVHRLDVAAGILSAD